MARPRKEISREQFEKLCAIQCTRDEICYFFDITDKTLNGWCKREYNEGFSAVYEKKRVMGKISLRRSQFKLAETNTSMAIFLGKNYLGQSDNPHLEEEFDDPLKQLFDRIDKEAKEAGNVQQ